MPNLPDLMSAKYACQVIGISRTYFDTLASQPDAVTPTTLPGTRVKMWTREQVAEIKARKKR